MTDQAKPTAEERTAARQAAEDEKRARLAELHLDWPFPFSHGDIFGAIFNVGIRDSFAVCLRCGSIVVLNDPEERPDGPPVERGVRLHTGWHEQMEAGR